LSQPIPRRLLPHTATLYKRTGVDQYGKPTYASGVILQYVRFEPTKQTALTALGEQKNDRMVMFFDCVNSLPTTATFDQLDRVVFGAYDLVVRTRDDLFGDDAAAHHYEVSLT